MNKIVFFACVFLTVFLIVIAPLIIRISGTAAYYKIGNDYIPSLSFVIGERKLSAVDTSRYPMKKTYKYTRIENQQVDIKDYVEYLVNNDDFLILNSSGDEKIIITKDSTKDGYLIVVSISILGKGYMITLEEVKKSI